MVFWTCALSWVAIVWDGFSYRLTNSLILARELVWYSDPEWEFIAWVFLAQVLNGLRTNWPGHWPPTLSGPKDNEVTTTLPVWDWNFLVNELDPFVQNDRFLLSEGAKISWALTQLRTHLFSITVAAKGTLPILYHSSICTSCMICKCNAIHDLTFILQL